MKGSKLPEPEKEAVVKKLARFTGLSEDYVRKAGLRVNLAQFMAELQRSRGLTTGRLDGRFSGSETDLLAEYADYDPLETAVTGPFTAAFNSYVREELKFSQDRKYEVLNEEVNRQWDWKHAPASIPASGLAQRRRRFAEGHRLQSAFESAGGKRALRPRHPVLRHRIHHGPS